MHSHSSFSPGSWQSYQFRPIISILVFLISSHIFSTLNETCDEIYLLKENIVAQKVLKEDFSTLEQEMKDFTMEDKIERLGLRGG